MLSFSISALKMVIHNIYSMNSRQHQHETLCDLSDVKNGVIDIEICCRDLYQSFLRINNGGLLTYLLGGNLRIIIDSHVSAHLPLLKTIYFEVR